MRIPFNITHHLPTAVVSTARPQPTTPHFCAELVRTEPELILEDLLVMRSNVASLQRKLEETIAKNPTQREVNHRLWDLDSVEALKQAQHVMQIQMSKVFQSLHLVAATNPEATVSSAEIVSALVLGVDSAARRCQHQAAQHRGDDSSRNGETQQRREERPDA